MDMVKFVIFGAIVGVANIIPGVSGGTMAVKALRDAGVPAR